MQDTITLKLPVSGKEVVIRNYTTRDDDEVSEAILYDGVLSEQSDGAPTKLSLPMANVLASQRAYIPRLVISIDGEDKNIARLIGQLRTEDYEALEDQVGQITIENSPKAKEAKKASASTTSTK